MASKIEVRLASPNSARSPGPRRPARVLISLAWQVWFKEHWSGIIIPNWSKPGINDRLLALRQGMLRPSESCLSCINMAEGMAVDKDARAMAMSVEPNIIVIKADMNCSSIGCISLGMSLLLLDLRVT